MTESFHPNKGSFISQLQEGDRFMGYYVLQNKHLETFRDPARGNFLSLALSDNSGKLTGRVWENAEDINPEILVGDVVKLDAEIELYHDQKQIRILQIRAAKPAEYDIRDMLPSSKQNPDKMLSQIKDAISLVKNPNLSKLISFFFDDENFLRLFSQAPAAKQIHHAYLHGLMEHTLELVALAKTVIELYPGIDYDLLLTGALLHDMGKIEEYGWDVNIDYSDKGRLLGHIIIADEMLSNALQSLPDFSEDLEIRLRHMLLSHHGRYEWGSPRRPKTIEAIALHQIENLSAQINRFQTLLEKPSSHENWTDYDRLLRRQLYEGQDTDLTIEERSRSE
ncbi:MAG: HD domain-containing protein [Chloroflexota bacterium]